MNTHTPGPWYVGCDDKHGQSIVRSEHIEVATCWHHCVGAIEKEMRANACLIAAAPLMLEALQRAADTMRDTSVHFRALGKIEGAEAYATAEDDARAAIAAATGAQGDAS